MSQNNEEGMKFDSDKVRMELLPSESLVGTAKVLTFGAKKYADRNWERGIKYSRVYGALLRHMTSWWSGEEFDPETGLCHLHHAACCISFLQTFVERNMEEFDDRIKMYKEPIKWANLFPDIRAKSVNTNNAGTIYRD